AMETRPGTGLIRPKPGRRRAAGLTTHDNGVAPHGGTKWPILGVFRRPASHPGHRRRSLWWPDAARCHPWLTAATAPAPRRAERKLRPMVWQAEAPTGGRPTLAARSTWT